MIDEENIQDNIDEPVQDELTALKHRADMMGLKYHPNIGIDKLRNKVNLALKGDSLADELPSEPMPKEPQPIHSIKPSIDIPKVVNNLPNPMETKTEREARMRREAGRLVRIRVSCMNPAKKEYEGEIFTVSNAVVGTFKKYVPYNIEKGWHVPHIIYEHLKERECQIFQTVRGPRGEKIRKGKMIKEFAIEVLPPLTPQELKDLAQRQAMAAGSSEY